MGKVAGETWSVFPWAGRGTALGIKRIFPSGGSFLARDWDRVCVLLETLGESEDKDSLRGERSRLSKGLLEHKASDPLGLQDWERDCQQQMEEQGLSVLGFYHGITEGF